MMKSIRKLFSYLLILAISISLNSLGAVERANAATLVDTVIVDKVKYLLYDNGTATAEGVDSSTTCGDIVIPSSVNGYVITGIAAIGFVNNANITSLKIIGDKGTIGVANGAFSGCTNLTSVDLEGSILLNANVFSNCASLSQVHIGEGVRFASIFSQGVFYACTSLTNITIPSTVTTITSSTFSGCTSLSNVYFKGLIVINSNAFNNCTNLLKVTLPIGSTVKSGAFPTWTVISYGNDNSSGNTSLNTVVSPTVTLSVSTGTVSFGHINPMIAQYDISATVTVQSNNTYRLSVKSNDDMLGITDISKRLSIDHLKVRLDTDSNYQSMSKLADIVLADNQVNTSGKLYNINFRLVTDWNNNPEDYSATCTFKAEQI